MLTDSPQEIDEEEDYFSNESHSFSYRRLSSPGLPPKELAPEDDNDMEIVFDRDLPGLTRSGSGSSSSTASIGPASPVDEDFGTHSTHFSIKSSNPC